MVTVSGAWGDQSRRAYCKIVQDLTECVLNHCRCLYENSTDSKVKNAVGDSDCDVIQSLVRMIHRASMPGLSYQDCPISVSCNCGSMPWWAWLIVILGGLAVKGLIVGTCYWCFESRKKTNKIMDFITVQSDVLMPELSEQVRKKVREMLKQGGKEDGRMVGDLIDLKSGEFEDAALGMKRFLGVSESWDQDKECTVEGIIAEVRALCNCPGCAWEQARVLKAMGRDKDAENTERLASALESLLQAQLNDELTQSHFDSVASIRSEIDAVQGWLYGGSLKRNEMQHELNQEKQRATALQKEIDSLNEKKQYTSVKEKAEAAEIQQQVVHHLEQDIEESAPVADIEWPETEVIHDRGKYGQPLCAMCKELCLDYSTIWGNLDYILHQGASEEECFNGIRDHGRTPGMTLTDFMELEEVRMAGLSVAQLVTLRLYTSHSFPAINLPLRKQKQPHPLPAIVLCISDGIKQLARLLDPTTPDTVKLIEYYRGFRDMQVTDKFKQAGGTELAPMSTTTDFLVACGYAVRMGKKDSSLLMKMVTQNNLQRGANLKCLSMFPDEDETLFPPLTFMQPTGKKEQVMEFELPDGWSFKLCIIEVKTTLP